METRFNPKKNKEHRRKRNIAYWHTGGRRNLKLIACPDCLKLSRKNDKLTFCKDHKN